MARVDERTGDRLRNVAAFGDCGRRVHGGGGSRGGERRDNRRRAVRRGARRRDGGRIVDTMRFDVDEREWKAAEIARVDALAEPRFVVAESASNQSARASGCEFCLLFGDDYDMIALRKLKAFGFVAAKRLARLGGHKFDLQTKECDGRKWRISNFSKRTSRSKLRRWLNLGRRSG